MFAKFIASSALLSLVAAVPMNNKREMVWVTEIVEDVVTVPVTTTVWVNPGETYAPPAETTTSDIPTVEHYGHNHGHAPGPSTSTLQSIVTVQPTQDAIVPAKAPSTSHDIPHAAPTSVYVAPVPSTTSVYVAPIPTTTPVYVAPVPTSTSVYVAPVPTSTYVAPPPPAPTTLATSVYVAPAPTSVWEAPATTAPAPAPAASASYGGSGSGGVSSLSGSKHSGDMTYYDVGLGSCGITSSPGENVVAISHALFDQYTPNGNPNKNPLCGSTVNIVGSSGSSTSATIVDRCVGCDMWDLDLSTGLWSAVLPNGDGRVHDVSWTFA